MPAGYRHIAHRRSRDIDRIAVVDESIGVFKGCQGVLLDILAGFNPSRAAASENHHGPTPGNRDCGDIWRGRDNAGIASHC